MCSKWLGIGLEEAALAAICSKNGDYFQRRDPAKATKRLVAKLQALGHTVTLQPPTAT